MGAKAGQGLGEGVDLTVWCNIQSTLTANFPDAFTTVKYDTYITDFLKKYIFGTDERNLKT